MSPRTLEVLLVEDNSGDALLIEDEMREVPGRVAIARAVMLSAGRELLCTRPVEGRGELVFRDEGPGLSPDAQQRLFELSFSTKPDGPGPGLSIGQRIVDAHGGSITVDSLPGRGTPFTVLFPGHAAWGPGSESRASA